MGQSVLVASQLKFGGTYIKWVVMAGRGLAVAMAAKYESESIDRDIVP